MADVGASSGGGDRGCASSEKISLKASTSRWPSNVKYSGSGQGAAALNRPHEALLLVGALLLKCIGSWIPLSGCKAFCIGIDGLGCGGGP